MPIAPPKSLRQLSPLEFLGMIPGPNAVLRGFPLPEGAEQLEALLKLGQKIPAERSTDRLQEIFDQLLRVRRAAAQPPEIGGPPPKPFRPR